MCGSEFPKHHKWLIFNYELVPNINIKYHSRTTIMLHHFWWRTPKMIVPLASSTSRKKFNIWRKHLDLIFKTGQPRLIVWLSYIWIRIFLQLKHITRTVKMSKSVNVCISYMHTELSYHFDGYVEVCTLHDTELIIYHTMWIFLKAGQWTIVVFQEDCLELFLVYLIKQQ